MKRRWLAWLRRRWLLWLVLLAVLVLLISRRVQLQELFNTLRQGEWPLILLGIILQGIYYYVYAAIYQAAFETVEVQSRTRELVPIVFAAMLVNSITPTGGIPGAALFVDDAVQREQSGARATEGVFLTTAAEVTGLLPLLLLGLAYLLSRGALEAYHSLAAAIYLAYIAVLAAVLLSGLWAPRHLHALVRALQRAINWLTERLRWHDRLAEDWAERNTAGFIGASKAIARRPRFLLRTLFVAMAAQVIDLASVWVFFLAFRQPINLGVLAAGFAIGYAVAVIIILPNTLGLMEATMIVIYTSLGVPPAPTVLAVLAYLGINSWLPLLLGLLYLRRLRTFGGGRRN